MQSLWIQSFKKNFWFLSLNLAVIFYAVFVSWGRSADVCLPGDICFFLEREVIGRAVIKECSWQDFQNRKQKCTLGELEIWVKPFIEAGAGEGADAGAGIFEKVSGKILMDLKFDFETKEIFHYGDVVKFSGFLKTPENFSDFDYKGYLLKQGIFGILEQPKITPVLAGAANPELSFWDEIRCSLSSLRIKLALQMAQLWQGDYLGLARALLLGEKDGISELTPIFQAAGISHLVAISGMHLAILSEMAVALLLRLGLPRKWLFIFLSIFLFLFVALIGFPASALRAFIMSTLSFLGKLKGRKIYSNRLLIFTFSLMLLLNPFLLRYDLGFGLSFSAVWGLINLSPKLEKFFKVIPKRFGLRQIVAASVAAQAATLPLTLYHFRFFPMAAVLVNLMIFWLIAPLIFLILGSVLISFLNLSCARLLAASAELGMKYLINMAEFFG